MNKSIQGQIYKPEAKQKKLPDIQEIVKQRVEAGIAGEAEVELYLKGDLDDSEYSDQTKEQLLAELKQVKENKKRFAKLGIDSILMEKATAYEAFSYGLRFVSDQLSCPLSDTEIIKEIEGRIEKEEGRAKTSTIQGRSLYVSQIKGMKWGLTKLKKALGQTK